MIDCVSVENMRRSDAYTIANLVSGLELIGRAAYGVFCSVDWQEKIAILCGSGNNGADGFALACILKEHGIDSTVYTVSQRLHSDCAAYAQQARELGVLIEMYNKGCLSGYHQIVDCMLGTGFQGSLKPIYRDAIAEINASGAYVVSVDINSGMNGDTGEAEKAVQSDLTVTIGFVKRGMIGHTASAYIKHLVCVDIGIVLEEPEDKICDDEMWTVLCSEQDNVCNRDGVAYFRCPHYLDMNIRKYR